MLESFRIGNHRSFVAEGELLFMPTNRTAKEAVVPVAAIYGANASASPTSWTVAWALVEQLGAR